VTKEKYDFSKGTRGRFYNPDAVFKEPVYPTFGTVKNPVMAMNTYNIVVAIKTNNPTCSRTQSFITGKFTASNFSRQPAIADRELLLDKDDGLR
jgi:hypothetical protein